MLMVKRISQDEDFLKLLPSKWWVRFFKKFDEVDELPEFKWKHIHQLAHISRRFEDAYGKHFSFSLRGAPGKCPEIHMIKKVSAVLGTDNQLTIREYVDWVFDNKIIPEGKKFRSVGFFANPGFCNEFHLHRIERDKITRAKELPAEYQEVVDMLELPMSTYGDLAFAKQALDEAPEAESRKPYKVMFKELYKVGFEFRMLEEIS